MNTKTNCAMNANHTPGPWRVGDAGQTVFGPPNGQPSPESIAIGIRNKANAKLIALAPSLLAQRDELRAALQAIVAITNGSQPIDHRGACMVAQVALLNSKD